MIKPLFSDESYEALKKISKLSPVSADNIKQFSDSCINQLMEYGFIECHITDYDTSGEWVMPRFSEYSITELGNGYIAARKNESETYNTIKSISDSAKSTALTAEKHATSAREIAESAKKQAQISETKSKKADIKGWISIIFSGIALLFEFAVHHSEISAFFSSMLQLLQ